METSHFLTVEALKDYFYSRFSLTNVREYVRNNTLEEQYTSFLELMVVETAMMPSRRDDNKLDPHEEQPKVVECFSEIGIVLAALTDRTLKEVERDLATALKEFPLDDASEAVQRRKDNRLS